MINYIKGDCTNPVGNGVKVIPHVVNNKGGWGAGFVVSISKNWEGPEYFYRQDTENGKLKLGNTQIIQVEPEIHVANMCAQHFYGTKSHPVPLRYWALKRCMETVGQFCRENKAAVHCPYFGIGLAGGKWDKIESLINELWNFPVFVYEYDPVVKGKEYVPRNSSK